MYFIIFEIQDELGDLPLPQNYILYLEHVSFGCDGR